jgi:hypothetical protein
VSGACTASKGPFAAGPSKAGPGARATAIGVAMLVAVTLGSEWFVIALCGARPESVLGMSIGTFLGLVALVLEIAMVERAERTFHAQGVQTTFMSFMMRLATVGPLTILFMKSELGVSPHAFALSYCATFVSYMCWLSWKTYHAPAHYRPKTKASGVPGSVEGIVVRENRRENRAHAVGRAR